jgi:hypothetical protein
LRSLFPPILLAFIALLGGLPFQITPSIAVDVRQVKVGNGKIATPVLRAT